MAHRLRPVSDFLDTLEVLGNVPSKVEEGIRGSLELFGSSIKVECDSNLVLSLKKTPTPHVVKEPKYILYPRRISLRAVSVAATINAQLKLSGAYDPEGFVVDVGGVVPFSFQAMPELDLEYGPDYAFGRLSEQGGFDARLAYEFSADEAFEELTLGDLFKAGKFVDRTPVVNAAQNTYFGCHVEPLLRDGRGESVSLSGAEEMIVEPGSVGIHSIMSCLLLEWVPKTQL